MSTTWLTRLQSDHGHRPRMYFTIQGIPHVFQEDSVDVPSALEDADRPRLKLVHDDGIAISPSILNMSTRRMEGGTVTITLKDDESGTLTTLFSPRRRRAAYLAADETASSVTIDVSSTTAFTNIAYIGGETITFPTKTATQFTAAVRGAYASEAQAHFGAGEAGAAVYTQPASWKGRRVYLYSYFKNDDGSTTASLRRTEGTYEIESPPRWVRDDIWEIQCRDLSDSFWKKKIGSGLKEIEMPESARMVYDLNNGAYTIEVGDGEAEDQFVPGIYSTHCIVKLTDDSFICRQVTGFSPADNTITLGAQELVSPLSDYGRAGALILRQRVKSIRHVAILADYATKIAKIVLNSRNGDNANGGFDQLPGRVRTRAGGPEWRMGAGLRPGDVDFNSFDAVADGQHWSYVIDGETTVGDFMFDFCLHTQSVAYVTRAGKLAVTTIAETSNNTEMTIDKSTILGDVVVKYEEESIYPRVNLVCNYDPLTKEFCAEINLNDTDLQARYPHNDETLSLSSKTIVLQDSGFTGKHPVRDGIQSIARNARVRSDIEIMLRRIQVADGRGRGIVSMRCHLGALALSVGSIVSLTLQAPDLEGARTISSKLCRVLSVCPERDKPAASLILQMLDKLYVVAPACRIASAAGADITLLTQAFEYPTSSPSFGFAIGQPIQVWDVSAAVKVSRTILARAGNVLSLSSAPGFVIEANVDFIKPDNATLATANDSATGFDGFDYTYMIRNDENNAAVPFVSRWR